MWASKKLEKEARTANLVGAPVIAPKGSLAPQSETAHAGLAAEPSASPASEHCAGDADTGPLVAVTAPAAPEVSNAALPNPFQVDLDPTEELRQASAAAPRPAPAPEQRPAPETLELSEAQPANTPLDPIDNGRPKHETAAEEQTDWPEPAPVETPRDRPLEASPASDMAAEPPIADVAPQSEPAGEPAPTIEAAAAPDQTPLEDIKIPAAVEAAQPVTPIVTRVEPPLQLERSAIIQPKVHQNPEPWRARASGAWAGLSRLFGPRVARTPTDRLIYAVGDVHGCDALLGELIDVIETDAASLTKGAPSRRPVIVFLGDYVDRGPASDKVISRLMNDIPHGFEKRFLKGNHEDALLRFLEGEAEMGGRWRDYGGVQTLESYGVTPISTSSNVINWTATREAFERRVPREHREFLRNLETMAVYGDYAFVHAGVRPGVRLRDQNEHDVMWIRDEFLYDDAELEKVIVHGHTAQQSPVRNYRRIGVDTGAYSSGVLTAVRLLDDQVDFLQTRPN